MTIEQKSPSTYYKNTIFKVIVVDGVKPALVSLYDYYDTKEK